MSMSILPVSRESDIIFHHEEIKIQTGGCLEFRDITEQISEFVQKSGIQNGILNLQSLHTTATVFMNEHEPLLLEDLKKTLENIAPQGGKYLHNDMTLRTVNLTDEE